MRETRTGLPENVKSRGANDATAIHVCRRGCKFAAGRQHPVIRKSSLPRKGDQGKLCHH